MTYFENIGEATYDALERAGWIPSLRNVGVRAVNDRPLTPDEAAVLALLADGDADGTPLRVICAALGLSRTTSQRVLDALHSAGRVRGERRSAGGRPTLYWYAVAVQG